MNKHTANDNIPTLTQIIHPGDESMRNHFDASFFDNDETLKTNDAQTDVADYELIEKQEPYISDNVEHHENITEDPVLDIDAIEASEQDFDTSQSKPQIELESTIDLIQTELQEAELEETIDLIIYEAVQKIMPEIEQKLTQQISQEIQQKFFKQDTDKE